MTSEHFEMSLLKYPCIRYFLSTKMKGWPGKGKLNLMNRVEKKNIKSISKPRLHYHYSNVEHLQNNVSQEHTEFLWDDSLYESPTAPLFKLSNIRIKTIPGS